MNTAIWKRDKIFLRKAVKILTTYYRNYNKNNRGTQQIKVKCKSSLISTVSIVDKESVKKGNLYMIQSTLRNWLASFAIEWWLTNER
jgi:hypothetical protein